MTDVLKEVEEALKYYANGGDIDDDINTDIATEALTKLREYQNETSTSALLLAVGEIRHKTGVGGKPMLSELADAIVEKYQGQKVDVEGLRPEIYESYEGEHVCFKSHKEGWNACLTHLSAQGMIREWDKWRDISTAPTDGKEFLAMESKTGCIMRCKYSQIFDAIGIHCLDENGDWVGLMIVPDLWQPYYPPTAKTGGDE